MEEECGLRKHRVLKSQQIMGFERNMATGALGHTLVRLHIGGIREIVKIFLIKSARHYIRFFYWTQIPGYRNF